jgi:hypothetical protein
MEKQLNGIMESQYRVVHQWLWKFVLLKSMLVKEPNECQPFDRKLIQ